MANVKITLNQSPDKSFTLAVFVAKTTEGKKAEPKVVYSGLDPETAQIVQAAIADKSIRGEFKEAVLFRNAHLPSGRHLLVLGLGDTKKVDTELLRNVGAELQKACKNQRLTRVQIDLASVLDHVKEPEAISSLSEGLELSAYSFDDYKTDKKAKPDSKEDLQVHILTTLSSVNKKSLESSRLLAKSVNFARWLGDTPGNLMTPNRIAEETKKAAKGTGVRVTVWDKARIKKEKMGGLLGVSLGSAIDPRMIRLDYQGASAKQKPIIFVGKALTFDSGGISIKPAAGMDEMKYDMCGGANVIAAVLAMAQLKLKVNVIALVPSTENMPGPLANKPGDILVARNGKTVEVLNTDAEGRLILMDALSLATELKPAAIFDAATLTGAILVALGNIHTGVFTRDEHLRARIVNAAKVSGELVWPMPLVDHHVSDIKGVHADLCNIGSAKGAGSSTAAAFLEQFVGKDIPWAHFDIAGTAWAVGNRLSYCQPKNASGSMIRTFVELAKTYEA